MPYCAYINGDCDCMNNALKCAQVSAVACRARREKLLEQQKEGKDVSKELGEGSCITVQPADSSRSIRG